MRKKAYGKLKVRAVAGTYVVFLAFDMKEADATGLMGFAIKRTRLADGETIWLRGNKRFPSCDMTTGYEDASSHEYPFQAFQWADYSAEPGERYRYRVIPMFGQPCALTEGPATSVTIDTEPLAGTLHDVHWNRGAIASQAFARRFPGKTLDEAGKPAYDWLARDLLPGLLAFIGLASDATYSLRAAIYEFQWPAVLAAFRAAHLAGADVEIVYHGKGDETGTKNLQKIEEAQIKGLCHPRVRADLMHNKFIVLSRNGTPVSVWTGSTNFSRNALHGQLNVGHSIHDPAVAQQFLDYWTELRADPSLTILKDRIDLINPLPPPTDADPYTAAFSPRRGRSVFDWWIAYASRPKPLFMTFPFGIVKDFRPVFDKNDPVLRFALLDKYVNGGTPASRAAAIADIERIRRFPNIGLALGNRIFVDWIDGWHQEGPGIGVNVNWVHTKFMLIDPLGSKPVTLTGSANWSEPSVTDNDENVLVIRGDKRVADIYFGEFMRLFAHHRFRESVKRHLADIQSATPESWRPKDLIEDWTKWVPQHFKSGSEHDIKRRYFAGAS
jgi:phosphatidylserine/phosphatidylglycerophosphate/cardiolipin synthase-like enzyme